MYCMDTMLTLVITDADIAIYGLGFFETNSAARAARGAERADGQPLARLTPGFLPLTAQSVP